MLDLNLTIRGQVEFYPNESLVKCDSANVDLEGNDIALLVRNTMNNGLALMDYLDTPEGHELLVEYLTAMPNDHLETLITEKPELREAIKGVLGYVANR